MVLLRFLTPLLLVLSLMITGVQVRPSPAPTLVQPTFTHGGQVDLQSDNLDLSLNLALGMEMEWISTGLDWSAVWSLEDQGPELDRLSYFLELAEQKHLQVMVSLYNPPEWVLRSNGPDPEITAEFISRLVTANPTTLKAVELFPGINTVDGWGRVPNPQAFLNLLSSVQDRLTRLQADVVLIPGLKPVSDPAAGDMDDLAYLQGLYDAGNFLSFSTIGIHYTSLAGQPMDNPVQTNGVTLRHYELVRKVMLQNGHSAAQIWITGFTWSKDVVGEQVQANWVADAFKLMKAQLFLGAAFFDNISQGPEFTDKDSGNRLILPGLILHPASALIAKLFSTHVYLITP